MSEKDEVTRWQEAIYELCKEHKPDVDGAGCDSGGELDMTLAEINEVFIMYQDQIHELELLASAVQTGSGVGLIAEERDRQVRVEGFGDAHDDQWIDGELTRAAAHYALPRSFEHGPSSLWPFAASWNKKYKHGRIRQLMIAGAFIAAEIDRLKRNENKGGDSIQ